MAAANGEFDDMDDITWRTDLTLCLSKQPDVDHLRQLCAGHRLPEDSRPEIWKVCLNVVGKPDALSTWDSLLDMNEQDVLREDCRLQAAKMNLTDEDEEEIARDMEGLITFYCKSRNDQYKSSSGFVELLSPFITLNLPLSDVYNCFYAMHQKFIPREYNRDGKPFGVFRLLLQYHDPQLCSFLDSRKIPPGLYAQEWLRSLLVSTCSSDVVQPMWDLYLLESDPFFIFYLMLVMVLNAKEQILDMATQSKSAIIEMIRQFPSQLGSDDIEDFCTLAKYYSTRTPLSLRKEYFQLLFGSKISMSNLYVNSLCLQVSPQELLAANKSHSQDAVRFFLVDCRPADQYNNGHLPTAFHLDANLMLQAPAEFSTVVKALFATQQQAIDAQSSAGGEHLCFMGSGREAEDQYVNMVVANFLQRGTHYVSMAKKGFMGLHDLLSDNLDANLLDHSSSSCIVCCPEAASSEDESHEISHDDASPVSPKSGLVNKLSTSLKTRGANMKERLNKFIAESSQPNERHVRSTDKVSKRYRNVNLDIFSIEDDDEEEESVTSGDEGRNEAVNINTWEKRPDVISTFPCSEVSETGHMYSSYILLTSTNLFILREIIDRPGWAIIKSRPHLSSVVKITSKRKHPDLITFSYGTSEGETFEITGTQRFLIPGAQKATKKIKDRIVKTFGE